MRRMPLSARILVTAVAALALVSCSSSDPADAKDGPKAAVSSFFDGIFAKDCKQAQGAVIATAAKQLTCEEVTKLGAYVGKASYKITKTTVTGDSAKVTLTFTTKEFGDNTSTVDVVKERGAWKVDPGTKKATTLP
ncbi:MAG: hypothetical protein JWP10_1016 [Nocardioidaceae bacterium]|nr:hypothetical protein [Nocardioidaceae bacterium]